MHLLPGIDVVVTSFAVYLQFKFASGCYAKFCGNFDAIFMNCCVKFKGKRIAKLSGYDIANETNVGIKCTNIEITPAIAGGTNVETETLMLDD